MELVAYPQICAWWALSKGPLHSSSLSFEVQPSSPLVTLALPFSSVPEGNSVWTLISTDFWKFVLAVTLCLYLLYLI